jgi:hypothetical protein
VRCDAFLVEPQKDGLGLNSSDLEAHYVRRPSYGVAQLINVPDCTGSLDQGIGQAAGHRRLLLKLPWGAERRRRRAEANYAQHVLEAAPACALLGPTEDERLQAEAAADDESADTWRAAHFVSANRDEIRAERVELERDMAGRSRGVDMQRRTFGAGSSCCLGHRLQCSNLVVAPLAVQQRYLLAPTIREEPVQVVEVDPT